MECVAVGPKMEEESSARGQTDVIFEFHAGGGACELRSNRGGGNALKTGLYFCDIFTTWRRPTPGAGIT